MIPIDSAPVGKKDTPLTPEALVAAVEREMASREDKIVAERKLMEDARVRIHKHRERIRELRRMLPRAPRKAKAE